MASKNRRKNSNNPPQLQLTNSMKVHPLSNNDCCFEGDRLFGFLHSLQTTIESELMSNKILPEKLWLKQHFAVGVNEVTRLLERMTPSGDDIGAAAREGSSFSVANKDRGCPPRSSVTKLQAVLVASDCNSRWLTKHLPSLASSRNVPLVYVKDNKEGSLRLGEVVKVKTAVALGIKVKTSSINKLVEEALHHGKTGCLKSTKSDTVSGQ